MHAPTSTHGLKKIPSFNFARMRSLYCREKWTALWCNFLPAVGWCRMLQVFLFLFQSCLFQKWFHYPITAHTCTDNSDGQGDQLLEDWPRRSAPSAGRLQIGPVGRYKPSCTSTKFSKWPCPRTLCTCLHVLFWRCIFLLHDFQCTCTIHSLPDVGNTTWTPCWLTLEKIGHYLNLFFFLRFIGLLCSLVLPFKLDTEGLSDHLKHWSRKTTCGS